MVLGSSPVADDRILAAAESLFYARGVHAVGMDDVRDAAGVSLRRLYARYPGKGALVAAYLARRDAAQREGLAAHVDAVPDPRERPLAVFDALAAWFAEPGFRGCALANCASECGPSDPDVVLAARAHKAALRAYVAGLLVDAGLPPDRADDLCLLVEGAIATAALTGAPDAAGHARTAAARLLGLDG